MTGSIAVISDVHGVDPALRAVLAEPAVAAADLVVVTGDLAAGPQPGAVLDRLTALGDRVRLVRGNADRDLVELASLAPGEAPPEGLPPIDVWAAGQLNAAHLDLLAGLPHPLTLDLDGVGEVLFGHGSPRDDDEVVLVDTRPSRWSAALAGVAESVRIVCLGHTHMPFARLVDRRWVVNSGSVGMPYGSTGLPWAVLDSSGIRLGITQHDPVATAAEVVVESTFDDVRAWVQQYILSPPSDLDALTAFAPRDGRAPDWDQGIGPSAAG